MSPKMARFQNTTRTVPARFSRIGTKIGGVVTRITDVAVPEFYNGKPVGPKSDFLTGELIMQADVVLDVDGVLTLVHTRGGIEFAIASELQTKGLPDLHVGDTLTLEYVSDEDMGEDLSPAKVYAATITTKGSTAPAAE